MITILCNEAGPNCFCQSLGTHDVKEGFDLKLRDFGDFFSVESGSKFGESWLKTEFFKTVEEIPKIQNELECSVKLSEEEISRLRYNFHHPIWEEEAKKCLSCTACTVTCPTCTCFGMRDDVNLNLVSGTRIREWHSCQLQVFTKVAGGHVFRRERDKRLKHRIYHKLQYYKDRYGVQMCVGCGRCITNCPADIDMTKIIKALPREGEK
ncbi:MAG: hypothetical protein DRG69_07025 [Deltaproteobacteria bacterium]|nr:MAG: hypothetical protein DRG69_07025 [Deltaproteobacteria bacterium]